ncbi:interleukin-17 receptor D isoform X1 [Archocentrus centrarchus]|uniref:interleukin-17 receptor D isoform X1 n=1 Tax=Archocentrus centrarchus TaxID=63155 RepID=UPI0011EA193A|nr:interleukin-17 receptor D-like isoform X1 [Archocentrus centrarchus]
MWGILYLLLTLAQPLWCQTTAAPVTAQDCSLDCIQKGDPACEYCRITRSHITKGLGFNSIEAFGSCIPWPCFELLGDEDPKICQHYVQAPNDVKVEFLNEPNPESDSIVVSWKPSYYGIAFLRGFQVFLQALGGTSVACQLFLFHRNISLPASHAQRVYKSDPFPGLSLGSQYAVTVMALPVPEKWEKFYHSEIFSTRSCAEKKGFEQCKNDWYPEHIEVQQEGTAITVTFNLAPPNLGIRSYFSLCYANGMKKYTNITPDLTTNKTHHSYQLNNLQEGANYTCEIAANEVDAVRKVFNVRVTHIQNEDASPRSAAPSLAVILPLCLVAVAILGACLAILSRRRPELQMKKFNMQPDIISQHEEGGDQEEVVSLHRNRLKPPRLLICYSSYDGPTHIKAVMQLGVFIQQHMATQVCLDLWDSLRVAEEGSMAWHCRQIRECDFVLVICSRGFNRRPEPEDDNEDLEVGLKSNTYSSGVVIQLIGEEVGRAKARGQDLSKYMAAIFEYSEETDIPTELRLISHYMLTNDLPLLFSHLHGVALHRPGAYLKIDHISDKGFAKVPAGAALQWAIYEAGMALGEKKQRSLEEGD